MKAFFMKFMNIKMKLRMILMSLIKTNERVVKHSYVKLKKSKIKKKSSSVS